MTRTNRVGASFLLASAAATAATLAAGATTIILASIAIHWGQIGYAILTQK
jgi:hypothetical protein